MSRREEVEKLKEDLKLRLDMTGDVREGDAIIDRLAAMALSSIPDRYVPMEEVTEGWWSCVRSCSRTIVKVHRSFHGSLRVSVVNCDTPLPLEWFTDFLPVPAWCVEGTGQ